MWSDVELRDLRVLRALAEELHFGRAAERCGLTQSRVSQVLRVLETRMGGRLVDRTSRRVALTPLGSALLDRIDEPYSRLLAALEATHVAAGELHGPLRIGMVTVLSGGPDFLGLVRAFEERHPSCPVTITELSYADAYGPLRRGEIDLMTARLPVEQADVAVEVHLASEVRVLAVGASHPLAARTEVSVEELADHAVCRLPDGTPPELTEHLLPARTPGGRAIPRGVTAGTMGEVFAAVARGDVVHPTVDSMPAYHRHPGVVFVPIPDMAPSRCALLRRSSGTTPAGERFVDHARTHTA